MVKKGDFIEETMGIAQREDIRQNGMAPGLQEAMPGLFS